ncbi:MAG TPA: GNAT family N-acetyltransferase [Thermoanaerobaculia bacterium]|nr:GNAT family N-acetyltransferase [Thermoanaerobaculia bacterium]
MTNPGAIELRDVSRDDLPVFFEHQRDPVAVKMAAFRSREWEEFEKHWERILADPATTQRAILVDGKVAGNIGAYDAGGERGERLVGYWIDRALWGRGVATRALELFLECEAKRPLHARVVTTNRGSIRVLEKCGFVRIGNEVDVTAEPPVEELIYERA